jgi:hypothetical protein
MAFAAPTDEKGQLFDQFDSDVESSPKDVYNLKEDSFVAPAKPSKGAGRSTGFVRSRNAMLPPAEIQYLFGPTDISEVSDTDFEAIGSWNSLLALNISQRKQTSFCKICQLSSADKMKEEFRMQ